MFNDDELYPTVEAEDVSSENDSDSTIIAEGNDTDENIFNPTDSGNASSNVVIDLNESEEDGHISKKDNLAMESNARDCIAIPIPDDDAQVNENPIVVDPGSIPEPVNVRRSKRLTKKPDRLTYLIYFLILLCTCNGAFEKSTPVLWRKNPIPVVLGEKLVSIFIKYQSPCNLLINENFIPGPAKAQFLDWCLETHEKYFVRKVLDFCPEEIVTPTSVHTLSRGKRIAPLATALVIGGIITLGMGAYSIFHSISVSGDVRELENQLSESKMKIDILLKNQHILRDVTKALEKDIEKTSEAVHNLTITVNDIMYNLPNVFLLVSHLASEFVTIRTQMEKIGQNWKANIFDPSIFTIFNVTLPCQPNCPPQFIKPVKCKLDRGTQIIHIFADSKDVDPFTTILSADPFTLFRPIKNSDFVCPFVYKGPPTVIFNKVQDCVTAIRFDRPHEFHHLFLKPNAACRSLNVDGSSAYWVMEPCSGVYTKTPEDIVQVKETEDRHYIYCPFFNITMFHSTYPCPDFVFSISRNISFTIAHLSFTASNMTRIGYLDMTSAMSHRVNFHLMPSLHELDIEDDLKHARNLLEEFEIIQKPVKHNHIYHLIIFFLMTASIITVVKLILSRMKKHNRNTIELTDKSTEDEFDHSTDI